MRKFSSCKETTNSKYASCKTTLYFTCFDSAYLQVSYRNILIKMKIK